MRGLRAIGIWFLLAWVTALAGAHDPQLTGIRLVRRPSDTVISVTTHLSVLAAAEGKSAAAFAQPSATEAVRRRLRLMLDGQPVTSLKASVIFDRVNDYVVWQATRPGKFGKFEISQRLYPEQEKSSTLVTVSDNGEVVQEVLLDSEHPSFGVTQRVPGHLETAMRTVKMGWLHILSGPDHVLFVLGLLLLGGSFRSLLKTVTAFTVAHSITLSLAVTGVLHPSSRWVEPLIALSIVAVAFENLRPKSDASAKDFRPLVAFGFGLIHGFGFAGALTEIGLGGLSLGIGLASFNVGVELGQASIVVLAAPMIRWMSREKPAAWRKIVVAGSALIAIAGGFWFFERLLS